MNDNRQAPSTLCTTVPNPTYLNIVCKYSHWDFIVIHANKLLCFCCFCSNVKSARCQRSVTNRRALISNYIPYMYNMLEANAEYQPPRRIVSIQQIRIGSGDVRQMCYAVCHPCQMPMKMTSKWQIPSPFNDALHSSKVFLFYFSILIKALRTAGTHTAGTHNINRIHNFEFRRVIGVNK